jgi:TolB-like protein
MKYLFFILLLFTFQLNAQTIRIAISDFENLSGNAKYDGLGKALSSMLISDIELNVSKKKLQLVERSQLNKILKEQSIQSGKAFDKNTTVKLGNLLGINFILIGDIFVFNDELVINARLTSVENGEIKFSNKQTGKLSQWLAVKTKIAKELSDNLKMPFVEPSIVDKEMSPGILASFSTAVEEFDKGNFEKAIVISETIKSINPDFNYVDDLKIEIDKIKKEIILLKKEVETVAENPIEVANNFIQSNDFENAIKYYKIGLSRISNSEYGNKYVYFELLSKAYFNHKDYKSSIMYADSVLSLNPLQSSVVLIKANSLVKLGEFLKGKKVVEDLISQSNTDRNADIILKSMYNFSTTNNVNLKGLSLKLIRRNISFDQKFNYQNYNEFKNKYGIDNNQIIYNVYSNGFDFDQQIDLNQNIAWYAYLLEESNYTSKEIAKHIMDLKIDADTSNYFKNKRQILSIDSGFDNPKILKNENFVIGLTGLAYEGPVHKKFLFNNKIEMYSTLGNDGRTIQCPCDLLIKKTAYDELVKPNGNILINSYHHAYQVFNSAWFNLVGREYSTSINKYLSVNKFYIKLSGSLTVNNLGQKSFDLYRMSTINLAHAYLLNKKLVEASQLYNNEILKKDFGEDWDNMNIKEILTKDFNDFISKKLITEKEIILFRKTYLKY